MKIFEDLLGKTLKNIEVHDNEEIVFVTSDNMKCKLYHYQDCCEYVRIEDINGNWDDLLNSPLTMAERVTSHDFDQCNDESCTWTFYKLATIKGYVTIRWIGESNGYYSETVDFKSWQE